MKINTNFYDGNGVPKEGLHLSISNIDWKRYTCAKIYVLRKYKKCLEFLQNMVEFLFWKNIKKKLRNFNSTEYKA